MNAEGGKSSRRLVVGVLGLAALAALAALAYWKLAVPSADGPTTDAAPDEVVSAFYTSLAALDVEQNERAATALSDAVQAAPEEPALWANLAVAQLRLREIDAAEQSLQQALLLAPDARELAVLRSELLQHAGEIEAAIEQLREVHEAWPENIAATWSLVSLLGQVRSEEADRERLALLSDILTRAPGNLRAQIERARLAATLEEAEELQEGLDALSQDAEHWPEPAQEQLSEAREAAADGRFRDAARSLTFFENLLKPRPEYQQSLQQLGVTAAAAIGSPLRGFLRLKLPQAEAAEADMAMTFQSQEFPETAARPDLAWAVEQAGEGRSTLLLSLSGDTLHVGEESQLPFPGSSAEATAASVAAADLNFDFRQDLILAGPEGVRIFLRQEDGSFAPQESSLPELEQPWRGVWAFDVEADGDLDLLLSSDDAPLTWIRNNGDMTFTAMPEFLPAQDVRQLRTVDLDGDGDVDLVTLDASGEATVWENQRSGEFTAIPPPLEGRCLAIAVGDVDRDGRFDVVCLSASGEIHRATWGEEGGWSRSRLTSWTAAEALSGVEPGEAFLAIADLDNNGAVDLIAGAGDETALWLRDANREWVSPAQTPELRLTAVADVDADGVLDLVGLSAEGARVALTRIEAGYGWLVLRPTANTAPGDQRINAFGVGGRIEVRAGRLVQAAPIDSPRVHFGLGRRQSADVARIVWPNGAMQAEFDLQANQAVEAQQRLKGSCPWVFAFDGREFRFVKDFIWRSPLGLRINAQSTAGVTQTEDWIKIPGESLAATGEQYSLRITAELWETHFFDHISLMAVDHPAEVEAFVDERFVPNESPVLEVILATPPEPFASVADHRGRPLDEALKEIDGVYADGFELGQFQGVAEEHWIEFEAPAGVAADREVLIMGHGWIYPTDSSLNVALAQGSGPRPMGLILEQQTADGWRALRENLGFPAGKNKDVVLRLPADALAGGEPRKFRLRTNLEIYWDRLGWSYEATDAEPKLMPLATEVANLRLRGYSKVSPLHRRKPDIPVYEVAAIGQRWLDLEGFYTRFGDVRELLDRIDDRYVIMNAGDEIVLEFAALDEPPPGVRRDFVLMGDGWVKDGDFNTSFSRWVRPLPAHGDVDYAGPLTPLEDDPVYGKYPDDWRNYHTRYVTPRQFTRGLWPQEADQPTYGGRRP